MSITFDVNIVDKPLYERNGDPNFVAIGRLSLARGAIITKSDLTLYGDADDATGMFSPSSDSYIRTEIIPGIKQGQQLAMITRKNNQEILFRSKINYPQRFYDNPKHAVVGLNI